MNRRRLALLVIGAAISLFFLWLAFRDLHLPEVWMGLRTARYVWVIPGVVVYFISVWFRSWRWHFLLRGSKRVSANRLFPIVVIGYMGNDLLPFRLGEVLRAYVLWRKEGIHIGTTLTTALLERLFDGLTLILFVLFGLLFVPLSVFLGRIVAVASAVFFGALMVFLFLAARPDLLRRLGRWGIGKLVPRHFRRPFWGFLEGIIIGLEGLRRAQDIAILFGVTVWVWLLETLKYWLVSFAFALDLGYIPMMVMGGAVNLLTALPSLPGYIGTFEMGIRILEGLGAPAAPAASYILVLHAILLIPVSLLGLFFLWLEGIRWAEVSAVAAERG
ncbi:MAG: lysylphosphatidylglycerol synthase transmembrane domain-containing protein [Anaerolineae bacterium]|nr:flippase-like domain-containing protein [Anaerolineae bacterium]MCX8066632.1 flippase-like domain-containing protein [Anaerolineae bacterium]MDW7992547.1 lysylphosphatidylglycerol synthase transmembrane domain-containing protein [Anaerolineae bacterium]